MRRFLLAMLFTFPFASAFAQNDAPTVLTEAFVTVRIDGLDHADMARLVNGIGKEQNARIEYSCVRSGVVVLFLNALPASERADVIAVVKRLIQKAGLKGNVDFLDVYTWNSREGASVDNLSLTGLACAYF